MENEGKPGKQCAKGCKNIVKFIYDKMKGFNGSVADVIRPPDLPFPSTIMNGTVKVCQTMWMIKEDKAPGTRRLAEEGSDKEGSDPETNGEGSTSSTNDAMDEANESVGSAHELMHCLWNKCHECADNEM